MATNCAFKWTERDPVTGRGSETSVTISMPDNIPVNSVPTVTNGQAGFSVSNVNADLVPGYRMQASDGVKPGWYQKVGLDSAGVMSYRRQEAV